ncbi:MAG TPA: DoxX family protein [Gammaproteobacteria bacterium]|nr:DoxX family protein [Gammaproteobacteria bacterium]
MKNVVRFFGFLGSINNFFVPIGHLLIRLWLAHIFFSAGLVKIQTWLSTVTLFTYEYHVPFLPPELAAVLATFIELVWPVLLVLGLGGRFMYFVLFVYNIIAVISYPYLLTAVGYAGLQQHINWGLLIMMLMFYGSGKLSLDYLLQRKFGHAATDTKLKETRDPVA